MTTQAIARYFEVFWISEVNKNDAELLALFESLFRAVVRLALRSGLSDLQKSRVVTTSIVVCGIVCVCVCVCVCKCRSLWLSGTCAYHWHAYVCVFCSLCRLVVSVCIRVQCRSLYT